MFQKSTNAWIGPLEEVTRRLNKAHADMDANHEFVLELPDPTLTFLQSSSELMITSDMFFFVRGQRRSLYELVMSAPENKPEIAFGEDE